MDYYFDSCKAFRGPPIQRIFDHLPLADLLYFDRTFPSLEDAQQTALKRRRLLTLLVGSERPVVTFAWHYPKYADELVNEKGARLYESGYPNSEVYLTHLDQSSVEWIAKVMPNIDTLEVVMHRSRVCNHRHFRCALTQPPRIEHLVYLLKQWSANLVNLKLQGTIISNTEKAREAGLLFGAINGMQSLTHLTLQLSIFLDSGPIDLPILGRLHQFAFSSNNELDILVDSLRRYGTTNKRLREIAIENKDHNRNTVNQFFKFDRDFSRRFTFIDLFYSITLTNKYFNNFCSRFTSLRSISIFLEERGDEENKLTYTRMVTALANLNQLAYLELKINQVDPDEALVDLPQLPSVQVLKFELRPNSHDIVRLLGMSRTFVNIQILESRIIMNDCEHCHDCRYDPRRRLQNGDADALKYAICVMRPLKQCTRLRKINLNAEVFQHKFYNARNPRFYDLITDDL